MTEKHSSYYEAIIQLRPATNEMLRYIKNKLKQRPSVFISKTEQHGDALDIYLSSQRYAQTIGRGLKKSFKGDLKFSRQLYTQNKMTSKRVYRLTVLFRLNKN